MSMTREQAIKQLESLRAYCDLMFDGRWSRDEVWNRDVSAVDIAIAALRGPTREQVEKSWRCEWISAGAISCRCSHCGHTELKTRAAEYAYCPNCGAPMTDEAVQMVMERLEAMNRENNRCLQSN